MNSINLLIALIATVSGVITLILGLMLERPSSIALGALILVIGLFGILTRKKSD